MRKAARLVGLRPDHIRLVPIDADRRMRPAALADAIRADRAAGLVPAIVCASSGTANTGAIDPLDDIAAIAAAERVWLHVDGAYGAPAAMLEEYAWLRGAFARADSLSLDPHKWLFAPADAGCLLVRDEAALRAAFSESSEYTTVTQTDPIERYAFFDHGLEMSRRFRGLKVWAILKARGRDGLRDAVAHDIALRRHLDQRIAAEPLLDARGSELSIACFRYAPPGDAEAIDALNQRIADRLVRDGRFYLATTTLDGRVVLRVCIVNFRTTAEDLDALVDEILQVGKEITGER